MKEFENNETVTMTLARYEEMKKNHAEQMNIYIKRASDIDEQFMSFLKVWSEFLQEVLPHVTNSTEMKIYMLFNNWLEKKKRMRFDSDKMRFYNL